ncbi:RNA polymerase sigma factor [Paenibacillus humicus]|uniref:RNA polymerase sigma factor n=1 Tax=Paenibacillus humicus TaxID=412861 RepID=UPI0027D96874|nr:RNA polymerase sigma factor [Paenibacillus humicus]
MNPLDFDYLQYTAADYDRGSVLDQLMKAYGRDVWNFALMLTRNRDSADDIAQDVFLKVYEKLPEFRGQSSVKTWILTITRHAALDQLRSSWVRRVMLLEFLPGGHHPSAEKELFKRLQNEEVWLAVLALPLKLREVLLLTCHYGMSMEETAGLLGVAKGTVKSRLHRARAAMNRKVTASEALNVGGEWI